MEEEKSMFGMEDIVRFFRERYNLSDEEIADVIKLEEEYTASTEIIEITVREWIEKFNNGDFDSDDINVQLNAGWEDWSCQDNELSSRLKDMGDVIRDINNDFILDNFCLWFINGSLLMNDNLYDTFMFGPIDNDDDGCWDKMCFGVTCSKEKYGTKYEVVTARGDYETEFIAITKEKLLHFINVLGDEFKLA